MESKAKTNVFLSATLKQIYNIESFIRDGLELMSKKANSQDLKKACDQHRKETENQMKRLERIYELLELHPDDDEEETEGGEEPEGILEKGKQIIKKAAEMVTPDKKSAMQQMLDAGLEKLDSYSGTDFSDLAIIQFGRFVEHFEIALYDSLCIFFENQEDMQEIKDLLNTTLEEERNADETFADIARAACSE